MSNTIEELENNGYDLSEFTPEQKTFIMALVKKSYVDGHKEGVAQVTEKCAPLSANGFKDV